MAKDKREAKGQKKPLKNPNTEARLKMLKKSSRTPFKVTSICNVMKFTANNLSEFRSLVQKHTGKDSIAVEPLQLASSSRPSGCQPVHAASPPIAADPPEVPTVADQTGPSGSSNIELEGMFLSEADMLSILNGL